jgi:hypothetical protein
MTEKMDKLKTKFIAKFGLNDVEWNKIVADAKQELLDLGMTEKDADENLTDKITSYYRKQLASQAKTYEGVIIGADTITDYGAEKKKREVETRFNNADETLRNKMIADEDVTLDGKALWKPSGKDNDFRVFDKNKNIKPINERIIVPDKELQRTLWAILKESGKEESFKKARIVLRGKEKTTLEVPIFRKIKARLNGIFDDKRHQYALGSASVTVFQTTSDAVLDYNEYVNLVKKIFENAVVDLAEPDQELNIQVAAQEQQMSFLVNAQVIRVAEASGKNNLVEVTAPGDDDTFPTITCWIPKEFELPAEGVGKVAIGGRVNVTDGKVSINGNSVICSIKTNKPKPIVVETKKEDKGWGI